ncbi:uncharacterized protein LOC141698655 [Apium graveolens]|uniref:uncharacterized protein LOC141698655 n=1 Tax=Apium graveolens TaxID=4045 RepID=UPI003D7911D6
MGLVTAKDMKIKNINVKCDSLLIMNHVNGSYEAKDPKMVTYLDIAKRLTRYFDTFNIHQIPRENNAQADALAGLGAVSKGLDLNNIPTIHIMKPSMERLAHDEEVLFLDQHGNDIEKYVDDRIRVYKNYLQFGAKPDNKNEARVLKIKRLRFTVIDDELLKKSLTGLLQRCLKKHECNAL